MTTKYHAEHVGSLLRPPWLLEAREAYAKGTLSAEALHEAEDRAITGHLAMQREAGLRVFIDGDTNWHVAAGRWILAHHLVPATDPFSFTFTGKPWVAHEWVRERLFGGFGWNPRIWWALPLVFAILILQYNLRSAVRLLVYTAVLALAARALRALRDHGARLPAPTP